MAVFHRQLPRNLSAALRDMEDPSDEVRRSATRDLVRHVRDGARDQAMLALQKALRDRDPVVRAEAAYALGDAGVVDALPQLMLAIDDEVASVRQASIDALGRIGDTRATVRLTRALHDDRPDVRFQAVISLARISPESAMDWVLEVSQDADSYVRYIAVRVAEELSCGGNAADSDQLLSLDPRAAQAARTWLEDSSSAVRVAAAILLGRGGDLSGASSLTRVAEGMVSGVDAEDQAAAVELCGVLGLREAIPALLRRAFGLKTVLRPDERFMARVALARLGDERATMAIVEDLRARSRTRRNQAVVASGKARIMAALPILERGQDDESFADLEMVRQALDRLRNRP